MIPRILLLVALLALAVLVLRIGARNDGAEGPLAIPETPRYYLRAATVTEFGADGAVRYELAAERASEDPGTGTVLLETVTIDYLAEPERRWHVTAERGHLAHGAPVVELEGSVELTGRGEGLLQPAVLRSPSLSLDTEARVASTAAQVELDFGRHSLHAKGLQADLKGETLQLESLVNGRFLP
ncbi:MAG: LPS export ABC transporter periplasmic protein LptC [Steroidobacteraceae bacterium]|nr:LPS export ABC transporter periplasmic protein LptC [Steroidobacteraceae bacterium]